MKTFYILNTFLSPHAFTHFFWAKRIAGGFQYKGFQMKIVEDISEVKNDGFLLLSDHAFFHSMGQRNITGRYPTYLFPAVIEKFDNRRMWIRRFSYFLQRELELKKLAKYYKETKKSLVLLAWFRVGEERMFDELDMPVITTGEYYYNAPKDKRRRDWYDYYRHNKDAYPMEFAANVDPNRVGKDCINNKYLLSFIGSKNYLPEYYSMFENREDCAIYPTPPFIDEAKKTYIYQNSVSSLGLQGPDIIRDSMASERIFDAVAYGTVGLTNSDIAVEATENCFIKIKDREHLKWLVDDLKRNRESYLKYRERGFEYTKKKGTYAHRAEDLIELARKLYDVDFR